MDQDGIGLTFSITKILYMLRWVFHCIILHILLDIFYNSFLLNSFTGLPTCLLCTCLGTTVYCDDHELDAVPPLPKKTMYFYSRYNRIRKINKNDFANLSMENTIFLNIFIFCSSWHCDSLYIMFDASKIILINTHRKMVCFA